MISFYFDVEELRSVLELVSEIVGYEFDSSDWVAVDFGARGTNPDEDLWFEYPLVGSTPVDVHVALGEPESRFAFIRIPSSLSSDLATRIETIGFVANRYHLVPLHQILEEHG